MIAFPSDFNRDSSPSNSQIELNKSTSSLTQSEAAEKHPSLLYSPTLKDQLANSTASGLANIVESFLDYGDPADVELLFNTCRAIWQDGASTSERFSAVSLQAATLLFDSQAIATEMPDVRKITFFGHWLGALEACLCMSENKASFIPEMEKLSKSLFKLAIQLGESRPRGVFNQSYSNVLMRLRQAISHTAGAKQTDHQFRRELIEYIDDHLHVSRSISVKPLARLNLFIELARSLEDPRLVPSLVESTERLLKLKSWIKQTKESGAIHPRLKEQQLHERFEDTLNDILEATFQTLKEFQETPPHNFARIWQMGLALCEFDSPKWRTCFQALLEAAPQECTMVTNEVIDSLLASPDQGLIVLVLDIIASSEGENVLCRAIHPRSSIERATVIAYLEGIQETLDELASTATSIKAAQVELLKDKMQRVLHKLQSEL